MKKFVYLLPILYILIILMLIGNHIVESRQMNYEWGRLSIQIAPKDRQVQDMLVASEGLPNKVPIKHIKIDFPQMQLSFYSNVNISQSTLNSGLISISPLPSGEGFVLEFGGDIYISFQTSILNPDEVGIFVYAKENDVMHIPFIPRFGYKVTLENRSLFLASPKTRIKGVASSTAYFLIKKKSFVFVARSSYSSLRLSKIIEDDIQLISGIPKISPNIIKESQNLLSKYLEKSFIGWTSHRFNSSLGLWLQPEGFWGFSEDIIMITYSEAIKKSTLQRYKLALDKSSVINESYLTWKTAFFYQKNPYIFFSFFDNVSSIQNYVSTEINKNNREILYDFNIWNTVLFWSSTTQTNFLKFIQRNETINISPENSAILLYQGHQNMYVQWDSFLTYIRSNKQALEDNLVYNTIVINDGYMLINSNKNVDVLASIIAGAYLSKHASSETLKFLGARMLKTTLSLSDGDGILPRYLIKQKNNLVSLGYITPEEIYPFITDNEYYARIKPTDIPSIYSYSASEVQLTQENNIMDISIDTKIHESTQYIYLWPIERPRSIFAFGVYWKGTPLPENMTKGVSYNVENKVLTIKILDLGNDRRIRLAF